MSKISAGLVMLDSSLRVLLVHPGGPFFKRRDLGIWSIPKGLVEPGENLLAAARREFREELGLEPPMMDLAPLGSIKQGGGKIVHAWAFQGEWDPSRLVSISFEIEWPRGSGRMQRFPEVDRAEFFDPPLAAQKVIAAQRPLLERALAWARSGAPAPG